MTSVRRWSGRETRALREALRMSVREFAARLGASDRTVSNWEAGGQTTRPRPVWQASLDTLLQQASGNEQARFELLVTPAEPSAAAETAVALDAVKRRSVLNGLTAVALPALGLEDLHRMVTAVDEGRRSVNANVADYLRQQLAVCAADDGTRGPRATLPVVLGIIGVIDDGVRHARPDLQRELLSIGARGAEFARPG
jgi:transcriptional regulator with XRE-family HTH domain